MSTRWYCDTCSKVKTGEAPVPCPHCCGFRAVRPALVRVARAARRRRKGRW